MERYFMDVNGQYIEKTKIFVHREGMFNDGFRIEVISLSNPHQVFQKFKHQMIELDEKGYQDCLKAIQQEESGFHNNPITPKSYRTAHQG